MLAVACLITLLILGEGPGSGQEIEGSDYVIYATIEPAGTGEALPPCLQFSGKDGSRTVLSLSETSASFQSIAPDGVKSDLVAWPLIEPVTVAPVPMEIQIRKWRGLVRLCVNGLLLGQAKGILPGSGGSVEPSLGWKGSLRIQPLAEISLSDDFMRDKIELGDWEAYSGTWEIAALDHPDMSVGGFTLTGSGTGSLIVGQDFWADEVFQVSLNLQPDSKAVGLLFGWKDPQNHHLLRWSCSDSESQGRLSVIRVREGNETLLAERAGAAPLARWLALNIACQEGRFQASVGGVPVLSGHDPLLIGGKVGIWIEEGNAWFDDVEVRSLREGENLPSPLDLTNRTMPSIPARFVGDSFMLDWTSGEGPWRVAYLPGAEIADYTFHSSPVDWRSGGGQWKVFSRWICSPKFTFMGGEGDPQSIVALWHTWRFTGDQTCEAFLGNDMCGRTWPHYNFGVNRCLSICGDGTDPLSGYALIWGGPDFPTKLVRKGVVIQENGDAIDPALRDSRERITKILHRSWRGLRLEKEGPVIRGFINSKLLFTFDDPVPIDSGYVCLWAWDRSPMVARCRIAFREGVRPTWEELVAEEAPFPQRRHFALADQRGCLRTSITDEPVDLSQRPRLSLEVMAQANASLRLVVETDMGLFAAPLAGSDLLSPESIPLMTDTIRPEARWHKVDINLADRLKARRPDVDRWIISKAFLEDVGGGN